MREIERMLVTYNYEFKKKLKVGFIGCGGHSYRNIFPVFQYVPPVRRTQTGAENTK